MSVSGGVIPVSPLCSVVVGFEKAGWWSFGGWPGSLVLVVVVGPWMRSGEFPLSEVFYIQS